jgi:multiple sugar transport system permease protein
MSANTETKITLSAIKPKKKKIPLIRILVHAFLIVWGLIIITPFVYLFISSLKNMGQFYATDMKSVWLPWPLHWENYVSAFTKINLPRYMWNSLWLSTAQMLLTLVSSTFVAYGFARFNFKGRNFLLTIVIATMMLPVQVTNIPLFIFFNKIGWLNSYYPLLIPLLFGGAWNIFLIRQFMITLPMELDEAATIDGCNTFGVLTKVIVPQCIPVLIVVSLFAFLWSWKDLWGPLIYLSDSKLYTLTVGLLFFVSPTDWAYTMQLAAVVIALVPTFVFYLMGQRYLDRGINIAELK